MISRERFDPSSHCERLDSLAAPYIVVSRGNELRAHPLDQSDPTVIRSLSSFVPVNSFEAIDDRRALYSNGQYFFIVNGDLEVSRIAEDDELFPHSDVHRVLGERTDSSRWHSLPPFTVFNLTATPDVSRIYYHRSSSGGRFGVSRPGFVELDIESGRRSFVEFNGQVSFGPMTRRAAYMNGLQLRLYDFAAARWHTLAVELPFENAMFSPNEKRLLLSRDFVAGDPAIHVVDLATETITALPVTGSRANWVSNDAFVYRPHQQAAHLYNLETSTGDVIFDTGAQRLFGRLNGYPGVTRVSKDGRMIAAEVTVPERGEELRETAMAFVDLHERKLLVRTLEDSHQIIRTGA